MPKIKPKTPISPEAAALAAERKRIRDKNRRETTCDAIDDANYKRICRWLKQLTPRKYYLGFMLNTHLGMRIGDFVEKMTIEQAENWLTNRPKVITFSENKAQRFYDTKFANDKLAYEERIAEMEREIDAIDVTLHPERYKRKVNELAAFSKKKPKSKTKPPRSVPSNPQMFKILQKMVRHAKRQGYKYYLMESDSTARPANGTHVTRQAVAQAFRKIDDMLYAHGYDVKFSSHSCRKILASRYLQASGSLEMARMVLGHKNAATTNTYLKSPDSLMLETGGKVQAHLKEIGLNKVD